MTKHHIMISGPKDDGAYVVKFRTADGETLAIPIPRTETAVIQQFQERMPYGLFLAKKKTPEEIAEETRPPVTGARRCERLPQNLRYL